MKFCDNLQKLRKEHHLSQEQLAEKLNVSRQAVSKWESGAAYPEMDKIIAMCKIFDCTLDSLVNDDVKFTKKENNKKTIDDIKDQAFEFIDKVVKKFSSMDISDIIKCFIFLIFISMILWFLKIPINYIMEIGSNFFTTIPHNIGRFIFNFLEMLVDIAYFIIAIVVLIYIFKIKYLDNQSPIDDSQKIKKSESLDDIKINNEMKKEDMKVSNCEYHSMSFGDFLTKMVIYFLKFMAILISIPFIFSLLALAIGIAISIALLFKKVFYLGIILSLIAVITLNINILEILYNFIFNVKKRAKKIFISIISAIILLGGGIGLATLDIAKSKYINTVPDNIKATIETKEFAMNDNLLVDSMHTYGNFNYIEDNTLNDNVIIELSYYHQFINYKLEQQDNRIYLDNRESDVSFNKVYKIVISDLQKKTFHNYNLLTEATVNIRSSKENIEKIKKNNDDYLDNRIENEYEKYMEDLENQLDAYEEKLENLEEKYDELEEQKEEQKLKYEEKIQEYQDKIAEYKKAISQIE